MSDYCEKHRSNSCKPFHEPEPAPVIEPIARAPTGVLRVIDFCAGTGSATRAFAERGHHVVGVELVKALCGGNIIPGDILEIAKNPLGWFDANVYPGYRPEHGHFSPPCNPFAVPSIGRMWEKDLAVLKPKHPTAEMGLLLLAACARIIEVLSADAKANGRRFTWTVENPRAMMRRAVAERHAHIMGEPCEVMYCRYGPLGPVPVDNGPNLVWAQKSTDLWTNLGSFFEPLACHARPPKAPVAADPERGGLLFTVRDGVLCHERAERGAKAGLQRIKGSGARGMFPRALSLSICEAVERFHDEPPTHFEAWGIDEDEEAGNDGEGLDA